jgi:hypothetical protein
VVWHEPHGAAAIAASPAAGCTTRDVIYSAAHAVPGSSSAAVADSMKTGSVTTRTTTTSTRWMTSRLEPTALAGDVVSKDRYRRAGDALDRRN